MIYYKEYEMVDWFLYFTSVTFSWVGNNDKLLCIPKHNYLTAQEYTF